MAIFGGHYSADPKEVHTLNLWLRAGSHGPKMFTFSCLSTWRGQSHSEHLRGLSLWRTGRGLAVVFYPVQHRCLLHASHFGPGCSLNTAVANLRCLEECGHRPGTNTCHLRGNSGAPSNGVVLCVTAACLSWRRLRDHSRQRDMETVGEGLLPLASVFVPVSHFHSRVGCPGTRSGTT